MVEDYQAKEKEHFRADITSAFYSAYFYRLERLSSSDLNSVLTQIDNTDRKKMTDQEMFEVVKRIAAGFGTSAQEGGK